MPAQKAVRSCCAHRLGTTTPTLGAPNRTTNLPAQLTSLVGRERELAEVSRLLRPGAPGHPRPAPAAWARPASRCRWPGQLGGRSPTASPSSPSPPSPTPASSRRPSPRRSACASGGRPLAGAAARTPCASAQLLLVLDNFEHSCRRPRRVAELLPAAPAAHGCSSPAGRRCGLAASTSSRCAPLPCPAPAADEPAGGAARLPGGGAVRASARGRAAGLRARPGNAAAVAEICRRLDGLPLALELAGGAQPRPLARRRMLARLGHGAGAAHRRPARPARAPADPARRDRLELRPARPAEQGALPAPGRLRRRLHARGGDGGAAPAAPDVTAGEGDAGSALTSWRRSWRRACCGRGRSASGEPRFWMLETVREFGLERLEATAKRTAPAAPRGLLRGVRRGGRSPPASRAAGTLAATPRREIDNLSAVVAWSSAGANGGAALVRIVGALSLWYYSRVRPPAGGPALVRAGAGEARRRRRPRRAGCGCSGRRVRSPDTRAGTPWPGAGGGERAPRPGVRTAPCSASP